MPKKKNFYFTDATQQAIVDYQNESNSEIRNRIYHDHIHKIFLRLVENLIHTYKIYHFREPLDNVKNDTISFMVIKIPEYDETRGRAFSWFGTIAKRSLIGRSNQNYKQTKIHVQIDSDEYVPPNDIVKSRPLDEIADAENNQELLDYIIKYFENNLDEIFVKQKEIRIAESIIELMRRKDDIEVFSKKFLWILVRERSGVRTQEITKTVNIMKIHYKKIAAEYYLRGWVDCSMPFSGSVALRPYQR